MVRLQREPIDLAALQATSAKDGALCLFVGVVRNENGGRPVLRLEYEAYEEMALGLMAGIGVEWNRIGFEFRYSWGMKQLATDEAVDAGVTLPEKTNQMQFVGKIRFN